jgi:5-formyltetrahydrofolate cyclo-ligase
MLKLLLPNPALSPAISSDFQPDAAKQAQRKQIRQQVRKARQQLSTEFQAECAAALVQQAQQFLELQHAQHIALYLSNDGELDTSALLAYLQQQGKTLYLPVLHPFTAGYLLFQRYDALTVMQLNKFGIREPKPDVTAIALPAQLDVIFMPLVAFDTQGQRLGMGGGFYDRTLAALPKTSQKPLLVGLAHQCQQVAAIPTEPWDVPLPLVLTPQQLWDFRCS